MPEEEGVSEKVWKGEKAGCKEVGRVQCACGWYDQEDQQFISNTISLHVILAQFLGRN